MIGIELLGNDKENGLKQGLEESIDEKIDSEEVKRISDKYEIEIEKLVESRVQAKKAKDYALADKIRDKLNSMGIDLQDKPDGTSNWRKM